ncbi:amidohydrolase [Luteimonas sp. BDR2-5]|uniref:amidohydrolase n=1 Tax=Proluteimonas luteida TaxID=2878685 RepID=UPI001E33998B|nr:amidohydrolase [Luteimonas sp. BDR2-5]MCD9028188.1 amidohydrolase [Luteimonas sp. BDR2-5]
MRGLWTFVSGICLSACVLAAPAASAAQLQLLQAQRVHTMDPGRPQADALVWDGDGVLVDVGDAATLRARWPQAAVVDAGNAVVVPGLIDAHAHLMGLGFALMRVDLAGARSKQEIVERLRAYAADLAPDAWLLGGGWDQNLWPEAAFPTAADLDAAFPGRPVWLYRVDGHAGWANSAALRAAEAAGASLHGDAQPQGGRIVRDAAGAPSGVFVDEAMRLVDRAVPAPTPDDDRQAFARALDAAVGNGLTGVHDMGVSRDELALYREFADAGRLPLRVTAYADGDDAALQDLCTDGLYSHAGGRLRMRGVKLYIDGALGSRGAAMLEDYADEHGNTGLLVTEPAAFRAAVEKAARCGVQVATHAIGDHGNRLVLDTYADVLAGIDGNDDAGGETLRWRVEHAQIVASEDIPRFAGLGVIASMQPTHATSDMPWAGARVGEARLAGAYAWRRFLGSGARMALGSDFPVEAVDPRLGLYAAVTRQDRDGQPPGGWLADQKLTVDEALRGFTADAAYAGFAEGEVGRLAPGLRADFVLLADDPLTVPVAQLDGLRLLSTWVDGQRVYEAPAD